MIARADSVGLEDLAAVLAFLREGALEHASCIEELPFGVS
jgi:hypothetical protein